MNNGFEEANPIASFVLDNYGDIGLTIFKIGLTFPSCLYIGFALQRKSRPWKIAVSIFGITWCCFVIGWWIFWIFCGTLI